MNRALTVLLLITAACQGQPPVPPAPVPDSGSGGGSAIEPDAGSAPADAANPTPDAGSRDAGTPGTPDAGSPADAGVLTARACFDGEYHNPTATLGPDYDQFSPKVGSHCRGTNHQNITGVQRVVFLGDSVTVGTPPTNLNASAVYRAILAKKLAMKFGITPPGFGWGGANPLDGKALPAESGAFVSCSKWGARTDDLMRDNHQVEDCIPPSKRHLRHLVVMTMGGNDIAALTKAGGGMNPMKTLAQLQADAQAVVDNLRIAVAWMKNPANVPGGIDVVFANNFEFTDGTGNVSSCPGASLAGLEPWVDKQAQADLVIWIEEQYLKVAVDTGADMVFMLETFCGHGYERNNPQALCYRGPSQPLWFDGTCIHPNADGHAALADFFFQTIAE